MNIDIEKLKKGFEGFDHKGSGKYLDQILPILENFFKRKDIQTLIESNSYEELIRTWVNDTRRYVSALTWFLECSGIDFLSYCDYVPANCFRKWPSDYIIKIPNNIRGWDMSENSTSFSSFFGVVERKIEYDGKKEDFLGLDNAEDIFIFDNAVKPYVIKCLDGEIKGGEQDEEI